jgi:hypothetical protein
MVITDDNELILAEADMVTAFNKEEISLVKYKLSN